VSFNICTATDSYKFTHHAQYPKGTERVYSYFESRPGAQFPETVFFGLQYIMEKYFSGPVVTRDGIEAAAALAKAHFGTDALFNREGWEYILHSTGGFLPVEIKAAPEGLVIPTGNVLMTIENTDPNCWWLPNHLETMLVHVWSPCTVATASREVKKVLWDAAQMSSDAPQVDFQLHDFGFRGVSSLETAATAGAAHLVNFQGTDNVPAIEMIQEYYGPCAFPAFSVPATEHSVMTSLGREGEVEIVEQLLDTYPTGILSIVGDSYDIFNFADQILGVTLREKVLARDGTVVVRPDSGDPVDVIFELLSNLEERFGASRNRKGYDVLNPKVGLLWGDGLESAVIEDIIALLLQNDWASQNIVFGMGGGLLQKWNRDTQRFAFKCSAQYRDGKWIDIQKDPFHAGKKSKKGRLSLIKVGGLYQTVPFGAEDDLLQTVFLNGQVWNSQSFDEVRHNARLI